MSAISGQQSRAEKRRVSMSDVARLAGVSAQTVSCVSNGGVGVIESTQQRVIAAMDELGCRPNSAARALKRGSFHTIGVLLFTLSTTGNMRTLEAITARAAEEDYVVTLIPVSAPTQAGVRGAYSRLHEVAVDAVTSVPATMLGLGARFGRLAPGCAADVVLLDDDDSVAAVYAAGTLVEAGRTSLVGGRARRS